MTFGDVIRYGEAPNPYIVGLGGDVSKIWGSNYLNNYIYEFSVSDFSTVRSSSSPSTYGVGIGGDADTIWHCDDDSSLIYELSVSDFSVINSGSAPGTFPFGIGGNANVIWHTDPWTDRTYELDINDFSIIRQAGSPASVPAGIGGTETTIWSSDTFTKRLYELDTSDFSVIQYALPEQPFHEITGTSLSGVGGDNTTIWVSSSTEYSVIMELVSGVVAPIADAGGPYTGIAKSAVSFDGSGSTDPDGTIILYEWDFGDGDVGVGETVDHIYAAANTYTVELKVTDDGSLTDTDTTTATISPAESTNTGRSHHRSIGASVSGGTECGKGKRR